MTPGVEERVVAFIRVIADRCHNCLHRVEAYCRRCDSRPAARLLKEVEADAAPNRLDYSLFARMSRIRDILLAAGGPLPSSRIDVGDVCSPQLKYWTLVRMARLGIIERVADTRGGRRYSYAICKNKQPTKKR